MKTPRLAGKLRGSERGSEGDSGLSRLDRRKLHMRLRNLHHNTWLVWTEVS